MPADQDPPRNVLPIPDPHQPYPGPHHVRRQGSRDDVPAHPADPAARGCAERPHRPHRRHGLRGVERVRRTDRDADGRTARGGGLKYNRFHTTALCSPTRQAMLTGRNHHSVGMGGITEIATSAPGYSGVRPNTAAPLAEILKYNGYSTAQFGKCHEVPVYETSPMGPFDRWPTGSGFEHFYGFIGGETNQYYPAIYEGTVPLEPDRTPEEGYHFTEDMTDRAMSWVRQQKALMPDRPFFMYFAPGATHAPHQAPKEWIEKYRGRFDQGWDALREETLARQKQLGVVPPDAELTARPPEIPAWDDMPDELKPVLARQMEVYAAFLDHTDHHVGRSGRHARRSRRPRRHARLLHHRRQRRVGRGHGQRHLQRDAHAQRRGRHRDRRVHGVARRRVRRTGRVQPLRGRLGARDGHAVPVDEADRVALGRHPQRHDRALAGRVRGARRDPLAVPSRDRRRRHRARRRDLAAPDVRQRRAADAAARHEHAVLVRRRRRGRAARPAVLRDVRQPRHLPPGLDRGDAAQHSVAHGPADAAARRRRLGAVRARRLDAGARHRRGTAREARRVAAAVPHRSDEVQRAAARRSPGRALQRRHRRAAAAHQGLDRSCCSAGWAASRRTPCWCSRTSRTRSPPT